MEAPIIEVTDAIAKAKRRLIAQYKQLGCVHECFGQKEIRKLNDTFFGLCYGDQYERAAYRLILDFEDWCATVNWTQGR